MKNNFTYFLISILVWTFLPFYKVAQMFFKRSGKMYSLFVFLNTLWIAFLFLAIGFWISVQIAKLLI